MEHEVEYDQQYLHANRIWIDVHWEVKTNAKKIWEVATEQILEQAPRITLQADKEVLIRVGAVTVSITDEGVFINNGVLKHNGVSIGSTP